jgi:alpha-glucosidase
VLPSYGFGPEAGAPAWLPQPTWLAGYAASVQDGVDGSMLELYRAALRLRRTELALGEGEMAWFDVADGALGFTREPDFACIVNVSATPVVVPDGWTVLVASAPLEAGAVPADAAAWLRADTALPRTARPAAQP